MELKNGSGEVQKVRLKDPKGDLRPPIWKTVKPGEKIEADSSEADALIRKGFEVIKAKTKPPVETKQAAGKGTKKK